MIKPARRTIVDKMSSWRNHLNTLKSRPHREHLKNERAKLFSVSKKLRAPIKAVLFFPRASAFHSIFRYHDGKEEEEEENLVFHKTVNSIDIHNITSALYLDKIQSKIPILKTSKSICISPPPSANLNIFHMPRGLKN